MQAIVSSIPPIINTSQAESFEYLAFNVRSIINERINIVYSSQQTQTESLTRDLQCKLVGVETDPIYFVTTV